MSSHSTATVSALGLTTAARALLSLLALLWLSACQPTRHVPLSDGSRQAQHLQHESRWQAEGKLALDFAGDRQSASFDWRQDKRNYTIHLFGPLGQGSTWLKKTGRKVSLESPKIARQTALSAESLMQENLGWQVPVSNIQYWIRGLNAPKPVADHIQRDANEFITELHQEGWQVTYQRYETFNGWYLPTKITAERNDIRLRLIIKQWALGEAPFVKPSHSKPSQL